MAEAKQKLPLQDRADLLESVILSLLGSADAWHAGYEDQRGAGNTRDFAHADGMDDAAVELADTVQETIDGVLYGE